MYSLNTRWVPATRRSAINVGLFYSMKGFFQLNLSHSSPVLALWHASFPSCVAWQGEKKVLFISSLTHGTLVQFRPLSRNASVLRRVTGRGPELGKIKGTELWRHSLASKRIPVLLWRTELLQLWWWRTEESATAWILTWDSRLQTSLLLAERFETIT